MIFEIEGRCFKATDVREIDREEFDARMRYVEETGRALPFEWSPRERDCEEIR